MTLSINENFIDLYDKPCFKNNLGSFKNLPDEIIVKIIENLDLDSLNQLELSSRYFWRIINSNNYKRYPLFINVKFSNYLENLKLFSLMNIVNENVYFCITRNFTIQVSSNAQYEIVVKSLLEKRDVSNIYELLDSKRNLILKINHSDFLSFYRTNLLNSSQKSISLHLLDILKRENVNEALKNNLDFRKYLAFRIACENNLLEVVTFLLEEKKINPAIENDYALEKASDNGHFEVVKILLEDKRVNLSKAIHGACYHGNITLLKFLLDNNGDPSINNYSAIKIALERNHTEILKILLKHPKINFISLKEFLIETACKNGNLEIIKFLLVNNLIDYTPDLFHKACFFGQVAIVVFLLESSLVESGYDFNSAFIIACEKGYLEIVKLLLKLADPSIKDNYSIKIACENGHLETVKILLKDSRVDPSAEDYYALKNTKNPKILKILLEHPGIDPSFENNFLIKKACKNGFIELVKILLEDPRVDPTVGNGYPLKIACQHAYIEIVILLLQDLRVDPTIDNDYVIKNAINFGYSEVVKAYLMNPRIDLSARGNSLLNYACHVANLEIVKILLEDKRIDPSNPLNTAINTALIHGKKDIVKELIKDKRINLDDKILVKLVINRRDSELAKDLFSYSKKNQFFAIQYASKKGDIEDFEFLKDFDIDFSLKDNYAFRTAAKRGHLNLVKYLLKNSNLNIDPTSKDNYAIRLACQNGNIETVKFLLELPGIDPSYKDNYAIIWASKNGHLEIVKLLLKHPKVNPSDNDNCALRVAIEGNYIEIIEELINDPRVDSKIYFRTQYSFLGKYCSLQ